MDASRPSPGGQDRVDDREVGAGLAVGLEPLARPVRIASETHGVHDRLRRGLHAHRLELAGVGRVGGVLDRRRQERLVRPSRERRADVDGDRDGVGVAAGFAGRGPDRVAGLRDAIRRAPVQDHAVGDLDRRGERPSARARRSRSGPEPGAAAERGAGVAPGPPGRGSPSRRSGAARAPPAPPRRCRRRGCAGLRTAPARWRPPSPRGCESPRRIGITPVPRSNRSVSPASPFNVESVSRAPVSGRNTAA